MRTELCKPKTILLPVDLSKHSASAVTLVSSLVRCFQSRVVVLYALEPVEHPFEEFASGMMETRPRAEVTRGQLDTFLRRHHVEFPYELRVEEGKPAAVIVQVAEEIDADLICMPTRGRGPFRRFLVGSTTAKVLNDAHVPVLTGTHLDDPANGQLSQLRSIVCALSLDESGKTALSAAALLAGGFKARLTVVHAIEKANPSPGPEVERMLRSLDGQVQPEPGIVVSDGDVCRVVEQAAKEQQADLVVIGRSAPGPLGRLRTNSYAIVRSAPCPVLSV